MRTLCLLILLMFSYGDVEAKSRVRRSTAKCSVCKRTSKGKIVRSRAVVQAFKRQTGYTKGRKGYVVDHVKPLCAGGLDVLSNLQWQTKAEAKIKDRVERTQCR